MSLQRRWRNLLIVLGSIILAATGVVLWIYIAMIRMPGVGYTGSLPPLTEQEDLLRARLQLHVDDLARKIGERNVGAYGALAAAEQYLAVALHATGLDVRREEFEADGKPCRNLIVEIPGRGRAPETVIVGAHYDTAPGTAGANDNAGGTAAVVELARAFAGTSPLRTLRFVLFVNEEPPYFQSPLMGSLIHARGCAARGENIAAMLSIETIGCYFDREGTQNYPFPFSLFYPTTGNFIAFVGNRASADLTRQLIEAFRRTTMFPSEGVAAPDWIEGIGWSDHWAFWQEGYPAVMITDTAPFRYAQYHTSEDMPDRIDYDRMARVVVGIGRVIDDLASPKAE